MKLPIESCSISRCKHIFSRTRDVPRWWKQQS